MKISIEDLRNIIKEELDQNFDHQTAKKVVSSASDLLKALEAFQKSESTSALSSDIEKMKTSLKNMIQNPMNYVTKMSKKKVVTFKKA